MNHITSDHLGHDHYHCVAILFTQFNLVYDTQQLCNNHHPNPPLKPLSHFSGSIISMRLIAFLQTRHPLHQCWPLHFPISYGETHCWQAKLTSILFDYIDQALSHGPISFTPIHVEEQYYWMGYLQLHIKGKTDKQQLSVLREGGHMLKKNRKNSLPLTRGQLIKPKIEELNNNKKKKKKKKKKKT